MCYMAVRATWCSSFEINFGYRRIDPVIPLNTAGKCIIPSSLFSPDLLGPHFAPARYCLQLDAGLVEFAQDLNGMWRPFAETAHHAWWVGEPIQDERSVFNCQSKDILFKKIWIRKRMSIFWHDETWTKQPNYSVYCAPDIELLRLLRFQW